MRVMLWDLSLNFSSPKWLLAPKSIWTLLAKGSGFCAAFHAQCVSVHTHRLALEEFGSLSLV